MSIIRGWRKQNRDALTFESKRAVSSNIAQIASAAKNAAEAWTPNRVFKIARNLACWALKSAKRYTDKRIAESVAPARFWVDTNGYQAMDANEEVGLVMSDLRYKSPATLNGNSAWLTYGTGGGAEATLSAGLWHHTIYLRLKHNITSAGKIRTRLRMTVVRSSTEIRDDLLGETIVWSPNLVVFLADYGGGWFSISASADYEAQDGDIFIPNLTVDGIPSGEILVYGYWCAHRVGSL